MLRGVYVPILDKISIHALRVEGDQVTLFTNSTLSIFLSTPSGWRATLICFWYINKLEISIHALRVEGDFETVVGYKSIDYISIHALRVEGDNIPTVSLRAAKRFLSTPSGWRATTA